MTKILFLCPHNAAKSALAAAYIKKLAKERGLDLQIDTAGTEPDEKVAPAVANFLKQEGLDQASHPRKVTSDDIASAAHIVSMGCNLSDLPLQSKSVKQWDDIPAVSADLAIAWQAIRSRVETLLESLK